MNILLNFSFSSALNSIKTALQSVPAHQQKIISVAAIIFASFSSICVAYRYCFKGKKNPLSKEAPELMANVFKKYNYLLSDLPLLSTTGLIHNQKLTIKPENMACPVMQFTDCKGNKGIALHIKGKDTSKRTFSGIGGKQKASDLNGVWIFYQELVGKSMRWYGQADTCIQACINERHDTTNHKAIELSACPDCPISDDGLMSDSLIENLLKGNDPDFQIGKTPGFNLFS